MQHIFPKTLSMSVLTTKKPKDNEQPKTAFFSLSEFPKRVSKKWLRNYLDLPQNDPKHYLWLGLFQGELAENLKMDYKKFSKKRTFTIKESALIHRFMVELYEF